MRAAFGALALLLPTGAAAAGVQVWPAATVNLPLGGEWRGTVELSGRTRAGYPSGQVVLRMFALHPIAPGVSLGGGYARTEITQAGGRRLSEDQSFQQLNWDMGRAGPASFTTRVRLEQRFQSGVREASWRIRAQVRAFAPVGNNGVRLALFAEPFVALNRTTRVRRDFDQLRLFGGLNLPVTGNATLEVGYLGQFLNRAGGDTWVHAVPISFNVRL